MISPTFWKKLTSLMKTKYFSCTACTVTIMCYCSLRLHLSPTVLKAARRVGCAAVNASPSNAGYCASIYRT